METGTGTDMEALPNLMEQPAAAACRDTATTPGAGRRRPAGAANAAKETFHISDLAREFGITPRTIRFWEDIGLLFPLREGQTRIFSRRDRTRLKLALRGKRLGLSLAEIKEMIDMYDTVHTEGERPQLLKFLDLLAERRAAFERQREDIEAVLDEIAGYEEVCRELLAREATACAPDRKNAPAG